jgi:hypothetical protein
MPILLKLTNGGSMPIRFQRALRTFVLPSLILAIIATTVSTGLAQINVGFTAFPFTPDETKTNGSLCSTRDRDFAEHRYPEKIPYCKRAVSSSDKDKIYRDYGVSKNCRREYTIDHFIPLSIGGTNRLDNLWPEPKVIKQLRKDLEMELFKALSSGKISQEEAVQTIRDAKFNPPIANPSDYEFCI